MEYIVLDLEWNQAWPGSPASRLELRGEIIQFGAVRLLEDGTMADEFQLLVRSCFIRRLNSKISNLTGIQESRLKTEGVPFPEAVRQFREWCGSKAVFLTWGFEDIRILRENLRIHQLPEDWTARWYNLQLIFNAQTDGMSRQRALTTAMETLEIPVSRPAHDALGDAYHTALVCTHLDLPRGIAEYAGTVRAYEDGLHGTETPGCLQRQVFRGYTDKRDALAKMSGPENRCPHCGAVMKAGKWVAQRGHRYMNLSRCKTHGNFMVRVRLHPEEGLVRVSRLTYAGDSDMAKTYEPQLTAPSKHRRRSKRRKKKIAAARQSIARDIV